MQNRLFLIFSLLALVIIPACVASSTRENVLLPAMLQAWDGIQDDAIYGGADPVFIGTFDIALKNNDIISIRADWQTIKNYADIGIQKQIDNNIISPAVAVSLKERLRMFNEAMYTMMFNEYGLIIEATTETIEDVVE